jgi:hypothetical protein
MLGTSGISEERKEECAEGVELTSSGWLTSLPHEETESMGVTLEGASLPNGASSESITSPVLGEGDAGACSLVITASCVPAGKGAAIAGGGESESEDRMMGALGMSPTAGNGEMREGG